MVAKEPLELLGPDRVWAEELSRNNGSRSKEDEPYPMDKADALYPKDKADALSPGDKEVELYPKDKAGALYLGDKEDELYPKDRAGALYPRDRAAELYPRDRAGVLYPRDKVGEEFHQLERVAGLCTDKFRMNRICKVLVLVLRFCKRIFDSV